MIGILSPFVSSTKSSAVADAVYESDWPAADVRIRKMLVLVIQRAHSVQILSGMDFFVASFPALAKVLKETICLWGLFIISLYFQILTTSYSYFTLLKTTYSK